MSKIFIIFSAIALSYSTAYCEQIRQNSITVANFKEVMNTEGFRLFISGIGMGYTTANALYLVNNKSPMYCQPNHMALYADNYIQLIEDEIKHSHIESKSSYPKSSPIENVLLNALIATFPCTNNTNNSQNSVTSSALTEFFKNGNCTLKEDFCAVSAEETPKGFIIYAKANKPIELISITYQGLATACYLWKTAQGKPKAFAEMKITDSNNHFLTGGRECEQ